MIADPDQGIESAGPRTCPVCGARAVRVLLGFREQASVSDGVSKNFRYRVVQCSDCGLGMLDPEPDPETVAGFYSAQYGCYQPYDPRFGTTVESRKHELAAARFGSQGFGAGRLSRLGAKLVEALTGKTISYSLGVPLALPPEARILELGFGNGSWLHMMHSRGYRNLSGFDIAANANHRTALESIGVQVTSGNFLENDYGEGAWDCIRLEHVLEHVLDPLATLTKCQRLLKPSGLLVMTLPCLESLSTTISLEHSPNGRELPMHLHHFTARSLKLLLAQAGFRNYRVRVYGDVVSLACTIEGVLHAAGGGRLGQLAWRAAGPMYGAMSRVLQHGELVTVVAGDSDRLPV